MMYVLSQSKREAQKTEFFAVDDAHARRVALEMVNGIVKLEEKSTPKRRVRLDGGR